MKVCNKYSQVTLELALAMSLVVILFWATLQIFLYVNSRLISRQQLYECGASGRMVVGSLPVPLEIQVDETNLPTLDIFESFR